MNELIKITLGILILILAWPIGGILKKITKEEQKVIQPWVKLILLISLIIGLTGLIIQKDWLLFWGFFISIVCSRSLRKK